MTPAATRSTAPPGAISSAGWKTNRTSPPGSASGSSLSTRAAPSSIAVWPSWPQACMTPGFSEANSTPLCSSIGSASMSARSATTGPGRPVSRCATTPCSAGRSTSRPSPNPSRVRATKSAVSRSWKLSSGWACRWRRHATTSSITESAPSTLEWLPRPTGAEKDQATTGASRRSGSTCAAYPRARPTPARPPLPAAGAPGPRVPARPRHVGQAPDQRLLRPRRQPRQVRERQQQVVQRDRRLQRVAEQADRVDVAALLERERRLEEPLDAFDQRAVRRVGPHDLADVELDLAGVRRVDVQRSRRHAVRVRGAAFGDVSPDAVARPAGDDLEDLDVMRMHVGQGDESRAGRHEPVQRDRCSAGRARRLEEDEPQTGRIDELFAGVSRRRRDITAGARHGATLPAPRARVRPAGGLLRRDAAVPRDGERREDRDQREGPDE